MYKVELTYEEMSDILSGLRSEVKYWKQMEQLHISEFCDKLAIKHIVRQEALIEKLHGIQFERKR